MQTIGKTNTRLNTHTNIVYHEVHVYYEKEDPFINHSRLVIGIYLQTRAKVYSTIKPRIGYRQSLNQIQNINSTGLNSITFGLNIRSEVQGSKQMWRTSGLTCSGFPRSAHHGWWRGAKWFQNMVSNNTWPCRLEYIVKSPLRVRKRRRGMRE